MQCKCTGLTKYANVSTYIPTYTKPRCVSRLSEPTYVCVKSFRKKKKEFKTALMTSLVLLLQILKSNVVFYMYVLELLILFQVVFVTLSGYQNFCCFFKNFFIISSIFLSRRYISDFF